MGHYSYIHAHFPVSEFSEQEQSFLAELRQLLPYDDEWIRLPYQEQQSRRVAVHNRLQLPGEPDDWQFVRQWQRDDKWYVHHHVKRSVSPPFPIVMSEYDSLAERHLPEVWLVAFTAPGRWQTEYWSIYQSLSETRKYVRELFGKLWRLFYIGEYFHEYTDAYDLREIRRKAPPGSVAHKRLRAIFNLFELHDFVSLHKWVLSQDLPK